MAWFQLDPQSIAARTRSASSSPIHLPSLAKSAMHGALGFTVVSVAGFVPWAYFGRWFYPRVGEAGLYATCAAVFIVLSGLLLHRLILGAGSLPRFYKLFAIAFTAYSVAWTVCWLTFGGDVGSLTGLLSGTVVMGMIFAFAFDSFRSLFKIVAALFVLNTAGYYAGGWVMERLVVEHTRAAMLLWGVCYGIGLGAGLGAAFHFCQAEARQLLASDRTAR